MTTYNETASGGVVASGQYNVNTIEASGGMMAQGCAIESYSDAIFVLFAPRERAFVCDTARNKGKLEKVVIKRVVVDPTYQIENKLIDTFNRLWFESELCDQSTAVVLAKAYHVARIEGIQAWMGKIACN